jgi:hypothetical protein
MVITDILYTSLATILVMVVLQVTTFFVTRMLYPPEPKVIYRDGPIQYVQAPAPTPPPPAPLFPQQNGPVLTQTQQEIQLPEYDIRKPASNSLRMDPELPPGLQETRPDGT